MLYDEFLKGTGCRDNAHNYQLYKELELIYMNSDCTKSHIYDMGKKLADNSKSEAELKIEADVRAEIAELKELIRVRKDDVARYKMYLKECDNTEDEIRWMKRDIKTYEGNIRHYRNRIDALKWVLA